MGAIRYFQTKTITAPATMPARAPGLLVRFQNREKRTTGPKEAPKPAQAKETMRNTELSGFQARKAAITAMMATVIRAAVRDCLAVILMPRKSCIRSWDIPAAAVSSWESAVDMVEAMMPASTTPATMAKRGPNWLSRLDSWMMTVSDSALVDRKGMLPALETLRPMMPMRMATNMAMTTQMEAMRREIFSFCPSSMAMNRSRMWGMPK